MSASEIYHRIQNMYSTDYTHGVYVGNYVSIGNYAYNSKHAV